MNGRLSIQVGNRRHAVAAAAILLVTMAGHTVLETARDSLFLAREPIARLPWAYGLIAVAALFAAELDGRLRLRLPRRTLLSYTLLIGAIGSAGFIYPFRTHAPWAPHAFYVWVALVATLAIAQFWLLLSELFTVAEAKRLYATISAGGLIGAAIGGALARWSAQSFGDVSLLGLGSGLLFLASLVPGLFASTAEPASTRSAQAGRSDANRAALRDLRSEHYLRRLLWLALLSTLAVTITDFLFKAEVARVVPKSELSGFFGAFNASLSAVALFAQLALAPRLMTELGVGRALLVLPSALALGAVFALATPGLLALVLLRGTDGSLRHSLHRSAVELLYLPLPSQARARWKMVVDALGQRGGQALGSLAILGCLAVELPAHVMLAAVLGLSALWLALSLTMERQYLSLFRAKIRAGAIETRAEVPALDLRSLESLVATLGSESDDEVLATVDLLVEYDRAHVIPALLLYHPSRAVVIRTLEVLASSGRRDFTGAASRLLERNDDEIRAAAMLALSGLMTPEQLAHELQTPRPIAARAAVLVAMSARGLDPDGQCAREIERGCEPGANVETRIAFARAFRLRGDRCCVGILNLLADRASPELQVEVASAMLAVPDPSHVPALLQMLENRGARPIAREALCAIGEQALQALERASGDPEQSRHLRAHLPRSISRFGSAAATDILLDRLESEPDGWVRFKIIRGLGQLRQHLGSTVRARHVLAHARRNVERALHFMALRIATERDQQANAQLATRVGELLVGVLHEKEQHAVDRAVRLVGLLHSANGIHNIRQALASPDRRLRADSIELLVHPAPLDIAQALAALLDPLPGESQLERAAAALGESVASSRYEERLVRMLEDKSEEVRCLAAYHIGELGLHTLAHALARAAEHASGMSAEVFARVRARLVQAAEHRAALAAERVPAAHGKGARHDS